MIKEEKACLKIYFKLSDGRHKVCLCDKKRADELFAELVELLCRGRGFGMELCEIITKKTEEGGV